LKRFWNLFEALFSEEDIATLIKTANVTSASVIRHDASILHRNISGVIIVVWDTLFGMGIVVCNGSKGGLEVSSSQRQTGHITCLFFCAIH
jgi:uncharacterized membrane protein YedE/YeeE